MIRTRVIPYRTGSKGAKALAQALGGKLLKLVGSTFVAKDNDCVINWGNTSSPLVFEAGVLNGGDLTTVSNKLKWFNKVKESGDTSFVPPFWTSAADIPADAYPVVCRTVLSGHSGEGIHIANSADELVPAGLYVKYIKKKHEYRIHIGRLPTEPHPTEYVVIASQRKARNLQVENPNWKVRNHANGFVYVRNGFVVPDCVTEAAMKAFQMSDLDFGAVDVIWNEGQNRAYVLEINTAPGLEGQTVEDYANFFNQVKNNT